MRAVRGLASFRRFFGPRRGGGNGGGGVTSDRKDGPIGEMSDDEASAARKKPEALVCDIEEEMENECCICLIDMEERKFRGKMDCCDHVVCWCCIQEWSQTSRSCPICQRVYNKCKKVEHKCKKKRHTKPGQAGDKGKRQPSLWEKVGGRLMRRRFGSARTSPTPSTAGAQSWSDAEGDDGANLHLHLQEVVIVGRPVPDDRASSDGGHSSNRSSRSSHSSSSRSSSGSSSNRDNNSSRAEDGDDLLRAHLHVDVIDNHHIPAEADNNDGDDNNINDADNDVGQLVDVDLADVDENDDEAAAPVTVETVELPVAETEVAFADQTSSGQTSVASSASLSSSSWLLSSASSSFSCSTTSSSSSSSSSSATGDEEAESSQTTSTSTSTSTTSSSTSTSSSSRLNTKDSLFSAQEVKEVKEEDECRDEAASVIDNSDDVDQKGKGKERETASLLEEDEAKDSDSSDDEEDEEEDEDENEEDDADYDDNGPLFGRMPEDNGY